MECVVYSKRLVGSSHQCAPGVVRRTEVELPDGARFDSEMLFADDTTFREQGSIVFGSASEVRVRTLGTGRLAPSLEPAIRHGTVVWELDGGSGPFERSAGRITSNFTLTADGEITDEQHGLIFLGS